MGTFYEHDIYQATRKGVYGRTGSEGRNARTVLVVDDEEDILILLKLILGDSWLSCLTGARTRSRAAASRARRFDGGLVVDRCCHAGNERDGFGPGKQAGWATIPTRVFGAGGALQLPPSHAVRLDRSAVAWQRSSRRNIRVGAPCLSVWRSR
jgi:hypothetical protein